MADIFLIVFACVALALSLFVGVHALFQSQSSKRNYFLLMHAMVIIYILGHLLEVTSANAEEAFTAVKILYVGGYFVAPLAFFFVADYCNIKIHTLLIKLPMLTMSLAAALAMWTTKLHRLVYIDYDLDRAVSSHLTFTPGPLYSVMHHFPAVCMILALAIMVYQIKKWREKYRKRLIVFFLCLLIPFVTEMVYYLSIITGINVYYANFTPYALAIMSFCLYAAVLRFNIFEIISTATASAMEHIKEGFVLVDEDNNYLSSNPAAAMMIPEIVKLPKGEPISSAMSWAEEFKSMEKDSVEFSIEDNGVRHFRASVSPVFAKSKELMAKIILFSDITDNVIMMKELENAAYIDSLTGLYNRKHFSELANVDITRALRLKQKIYVGMLDLDFFKNINDTYGHAAGDLILKTTASIIRQTTRSYDLVGRYGGEEFAFLITDLEPAEAFNLVERIRENMENHVAIFEDVEIKTTCSIGLAQFLEDDTLESSLRKADTALYAAKNSGRNHVRLCKQLVQSCTA